MHFIRLFLLFCLRYFHIKQALAFRKQPQRKAGAMSSSNHPPTPINTIGSELDPVKNDTKAIAKFLGCTPRMVAKLCETGKLRAFRVGNRWRVTRDAVLEYAGLV